MRPLRIQVAIGTNHEQRCAHTELAEGKMCVGCVRMIIDAMLGLVNDAQTSDDEPLAMGLIEQGLLRLDTQLAGVGALVRAQAAERQLYGGLTSIEIENVRVLGYSVEEIMRAIQVVHELGLEDRIRPRDDDAKASRLRRYWR